VGRCAALVVEGVDGLKFKSHMYVFIDSAKGHHSQSRRGLSFQTGCIAES
jgi:hypothetical protein